MNMLMVNKHCLLYQVRLQDDQWQNQTITMNRNYGQIKTLHIARLMPTKKAVR